MNSDVVSVVVAVLILAFDLVIRVLALIFVPKNRRPATATAWLLAIFFIPYFGLIAFLLLGTNQLPKRRRDKQKEINQFIVDSTDGVEQMRTDEPWPPWLAGTVQLNRTLGAMPLVGGNSASLLGDYNRTILAMAAEVDLATTFVHAEFYICIRDDTTRPFFDALAAAVQRGVTVRVLMDHIACAKTKGSRSTKRFLTKAGVDWHLMLPVQPWRGRYQRPDLRNHRKLVVVDGRVGFMGSQNMIDRTYNKLGNRRRGLRWLDLMVRLEGPVVAGVNAIFLTDWYSETGDLLGRDQQLSVEPVGDQGLDCQLVPSGPGFDGENNLRLFNTLIYAAKSKIMLTSPYFVPDDSMLYAVTTAAQRGVRVELFVSEIGDQALVFHAQRSYYEALLRAGVVIWLYRGPTILHAKHFTIDDDVAVIGSSNMDMRSFTLNLEMSLLVRGTGFVDRLRQVQAGYRKASRRLTLEEWQRRPLLSAALDNVCRLTAGLQ